MTIGTDDRASILWRRLHQPGHDWAQLAMTASGLRLSGVSLFADEGRPCRLDYVILCEPDGRPRSAAVSGWIGGLAVRRAVDLDPAGRWLMDGFDQPAVSGCVDLDFEFTPSTNLLHLRRMGLAPGQRADVRAAWLRFPELVLEPLEQRYHRRSETTYGYESLSPVPFAADLEVASSGFVTSYPGLWKADALFEQAAGEGDALEPLEAPGTLERA
jgi:uncharacterized protein